LTGQAGSKLFNTSLERGLQILAAFDRGQRSLGLMQLVAMTGLEKTAVQRFTATLVALGYLRKDPVTRRYALAPRILRLGASFLRGNPLIERAVPYMLSCNREIGETVNLGVLDESDLIIVARIPGRHLVSPNVGLGSSFPWHVSALGQALVACLPKPERGRLVAAVTFTRFASGTIMDRADLAARLDQGLERGLVVARDETCEGDVSIACPVFDASSQVVAAVGISCPRRPAGDLRDLEGAVRALAGAVSSDQGLARSAGRD
jgi:DNA-binding IclR family transcriptional regulator